MFILFQEALSYPFFQRALLAAILASITCGIMGSFVVVKRMSSISGGLSHAAFGGVGLGYFFGFSPMLGAAAFGVLSGLVIGVVYLKYRHSLDTLIAIVWSLGMALGILLVALTPGYAPDLNSYLFGSILFVPQEYIAWVAVLDVVVLLVVGFYFKQLQAASFDEEFCIVSGVPQQRLFLLVMLLTSLTVVTLMRVVGAIMLISLLTIPAVIARQWSDNLRRMMVYAVAISCVCAGIGLFASFWLSHQYRLDAPTGPLIILLSALIYLCSLGLQKITITRGA